MALYVSAERLRAAVDRLRQSRASGGMVNFLILKRAVAIANGESVALSTKDKRLQQAITELTWWPADSMSNDERPFIDVFGSIKDKTHGMKKHKYRSTGPSDTLRNGAWSPVVAIGEGPRSKVANLQVNYRSGLAELALLKDKQRPLPQLRDAAVWYFRSRDVESIIGDAENPEAIETKLADAFCTELRLASEDVTVLFANEAEDD